MVNRVTIVICLFSMWSPSCGGWECLPSRRRKEWEYFSGEERSKDCFSNVGFIRRLLRSSPAQSHLHSRALWSLLHVLSYRCPEDCRGGGCKNHLSAADDSWGSGQCHSFLLQHLSSLTGTQAETHTHDSDPHGRVQSLGSSLPENSLHNGSFCFEEPPVQSWV